MKAGICVISAILVFALIGASDAVTTRLTPVADAYIDNWIPNQNFGLSTDGFTFQEIDPNTGETTGRNFHLLAMFNISSLSTNVTAATIYYKQQWAVQSELASPNILFDLYKIPTNWTETTVTYNNAPSAISTIVSSVQDNNIDYIIANVADALKTARLNGENLFAVKYSSNYSGQSEMVDVYTRECAPSDRPYLLVTM